MCVKKERKESAKKSEVKKKVEKGSERKSERLVGLCAQVLKVSYQVLQPVCYLCLVQNFGWV
jgi:hypothetical protein